MPKLPVVSAKELINFLKKRGFTKDRQKGAHIVYVKDNLTAVVPDHRTVLIGTLHDILKKAKIDRQDFVDFIQPPKTRAQKK